MAVNQIGDLHIVASECPTEATVYDECFHVATSGLLLSLFVQETTGTVDVDIYTLTKKGHQKLIDSFPQITGPTTEILLRKQVEVHDQIRVVITTSDAAKFDIRAKGVEASLASVQVQGADAWQVTNESITTRALLIAADLEDRNGLMIRNANFSGVEILRVAESEAKLIAGVWASLLPGEAIQPDLRAGSEVWAESDTGGAIRVEITEIG